MNAISFTLWMASTKDDDALVSIVVAISQIAARRATGVLEAFSEPLLQP